MDNRLSIEVMDLIKSRGGKTTVWKELALLIPEDQPKTAWYRKTPEQTDAEPEYGLKSSMFRKEWFVGWNSAECDESEDPIPMFPCDGCLMGPNMIHAWLNKPDVGADNWIPFTAHLEDFIGAGSLAEYNGGVQVGFKKLYLGQADKELGTKMLVERRREGKDIPQVAGLGWGGSLNNIGNFPSITPQPAVSQLLAPGGPMPSFDQWRNMQFQGIAVKQELTAGDLLGGPLGLKAVEVRARSLTGAGGVPMYQNGARWLAPTDEEDLPF
jgi:hypothetical protein